MFLFILYFPTSITYLKVSLQTNWKLSINWILLLNYWVIPKAENNNADIKLKVTGARFVLFNKNERFLARFVSVINRGSGEHIIFHGAGNIDLHDKYFVM